MDNRDSQTELRPIIYALGRLFTRQFSPTPTGIDRLDLRYAHWLLQQRQNGRPVFFVRQVCNVIRMVPAATAERLISELWQKWVIGTPVAVNYTLRRVEVESFWLRNKIRSFYKPSLDKKLLQILRNYLQPYYLNAAHIGTQFTDAHKLLREQANAELIFYLHDIIPIDYPEYFSNAQGDKIHYGRVKLMAQQGALILVNSQHTADRFRALCNREGWCQPPTQVLPIGVEDHIIEAAAKPPKKMPEYLRRRLGDAPYFVILGTIEPRKNHLLLLHIWRQMAQEQAATGINCPKLLIIGRRGWENENIIDMLDRCHWIKPHVVEVNGMTDGDLIAALQHARALLMPSFEEGWGIPLAEALTLKTRVVCSDIPALRESSKGMAKYVSPIDGHGWINAINGMLNTEECVIHYPADVWKEHFSDIERLLSR